MSPSPYRRAPRLHVDITRHEVDDVITTGGRRWIIREIHDDGRVYLEASNASPAIGWHTTLDNLPDPIKEHR